MEYTIDVQFILSWNDSRLDFPSCCHSNRPVEPGCNSDTDTDEKSDKCHQNNESNPKNCSNNCKDKYDVRVVKSRIWKPDLFFVNSKNIYFHNEPLPNIRFLLRPEGNLVYTKRLTLDLECRMDVRNFPLDTQYCPLIICSNTLNENDLLLAWDDYNAESVQLDPDVELTEFDLISPVKTGTRKLMYDGTDISGNFSCVNATFVFKRQNSYHLVYSYMLTTFIVIVSWMSFWLDVNSAPARTSLGVTTLLTLTTTASSIRSHLPPVAYVTAVDVWLGFCSFFVFTALLEFPLSNYIARRPMPRPWTPPKWLYLRRSVGKDNSVSSLTSQESLPSSNCSGGGGQQKMTTGIEDAHLLDKCCRVAYPVLFLIFNAIYWPFYIYEASFRTDRHDG